jgi:hypothetical protein
VLCCAATAAAEHPGTQHATHKKLFAPTTAPPDPARPSVCCAVVGAWGECQDAVCTTGAVSVTLGFKRQQPHARANQATACTCKKGDHQKRGARITHTPTCYAYDSKLRQLQHSTCTHCAQYDCWAARPAYDVRRPMQMYVHFSIAAAPPPTAAFAPLIYLQMYASCAPLSRLPLGKHNSKECSTSNKTKGCQQALQSPANTPHTKATNECKALFCTQAGVGSTRTGNSNSGMSVLQRQQAVHSPVNRLPC